MIPAALQQRRFWLRVAAISAIGFVTLITLEFTDIDRALARFSFDSTAGRFPLQDSEALIWTSHTAVKGLAGIVFGWILVAAWRPLGPLSTLARPSRIYLVAAVVVCLVVVASLKRVSAIHCPWGLAEFGGQATYLRLLDPVPADWVRGGCFPAGHALSAFAFIGGFFAFAPTDARLARHWLIVVLLAGAFAGVAQQLRGAHFLSHTLWTLWCCWTLSALLAWLFRARLRLINGASAAGR